MIVRRPTRVLVQAALTAFVITIAPVATPAAASSPHRAGSTAGLSERQQVTVEVWLTPNLAGAEKFAMAASTPGTQSFHHFLSPDAYTARFGATEAEASAVAQWLTTSGLHQVRASGRNYVSASGSALAVGSVLSAELVPDSVAATTASLPVSGNDRGIVLPAEIADDVLGVTGLGTKPVARTPGAPQPAATVQDVTPTCSDYWAQHVHSVRPAFREFTTASLPICGYSATQLRAAYGVTWANTGRGQTVALTESDAPPAMALTLKDYAKVNDLPVPAAGQFRQINAGGGGQCATAAAPSHRASVSSYDDEVEMDSEAVYAMAPHANQLMVVGSGCDEDQADLNSILAVLTGNGRHPSASIVSNSWHSSTYPAEAQAIDVRAAAEGVGLYFASGDGPGASGTEEDPFAVVVGGTTLGVGAKTQRVVETGWSDDAAYLYHGEWDDLGIATAGGGGTSLKFRQPAYQTGVVPSSMSHVRIGKNVVADRTVPDISADADPDTAMLVGHLTTTSSGKPGSYLTQATGGTSLSTPLIAGLVADAQQGQTSSFGFTNPLFYRLVGTSALRDVLPVQASMTQPNRAVYTPPASSADSARIDLLDAQQHPDTRQVTAKGYDTMTGVGTPNGVAFIAGLRRLARRRTR